MADGLEATGSFEERSSVATKTINPIAMIISAGTRSLRGVPALSPLAVVLRGKTAELPEGLGPAGFAPDLDFALGAGGLGGAVVKSSESAAGSGVAGAAGFFAFRRESSLLMVHADGTVSNGSRQILLSRTGPSSFTLWRIRNALSPSPRGSKVGQNRRSRHSSRP